MVYKLPVSLRCIQRSFSAKTEFHVFVNADSYDSQATELQQLKVKIISTSVCNRPDWYNNKVDKKSMICAGYKDSCGGDSGGPLACPNPNGRYTMFGVVSWGEKCAAAKKPGVYVKTAAVLGWIKKYVPGAHVHFAPQYVCISIRLGPGLLESVIAQQ